MWAPVKPNGDLGTTGHQNHQQLMQTWRDDAVKKSELGDSAKLPEITGSGTGPEIGEGPNRVEVDINAPKLEPIDTSNQTLDALQNKNPTDKPVTVSNNAKLAEPVQTDNTFIKPSTSDNVKVDTDAGADAQAGLDQTDTKTSTSGVEVDPTDTKPVTTKSPTLTKPSDRKDVDPELDTTTTRPKVVTTTPTLPTDNTQLAHTKNA